MSSETERSEPDLLQHEAEHVRPANKSRVMIYLVVLFAAAFLLMVMTYFMQQRQSEVAMDSLKQSMDNMSDDMRSIEELREENSALLAQIEHHKSQQRQLEDQANALETAREVAVYEGLQLQKQLDALSTLNQLRALYNQGKYSAGRELLAAAPSDLEETLKTLSERLTEEQRTVYDPFAAYQTIYGWLNQ